MKQIMRVEVGALGARQVNHARGVFGRLSSKGTRVGGCLMRRVLPVLYIYEDGGAWLSCALQCSIGYFGKSKLYAARL